jgi:hypothetical protein
MLVSNLIRMSSTRGRYEYVLPLIRNHQHHSLQLLDPNQHSLAGALHAGSAGEFETTKCPNPNPSQRPQTAATSMVDATERMLLFSQRSSSPSLRSHRCAHVDKENQ